MKKPLITIGMLTYNHEKYILDALRSLLSQEFECIELLILDDASTDNTPLIIEQNMEKLKRKFERVVFIRHKKNCGSISQNCNQMMKIMRGDFYFSFSGDDILLPQCIYLLYDKLQEHPECMVIHANVIQVPDSYIYGDKISEHDVFWKNRKSGLEPENFFYQLMYGNAVVALSVMYRKEVINIYGYHDEDIMYEDYEYWLRISRTEKFYYYNQVVALYRKAKTSITNFKEDSYYKLNVAIYSDYLTKQKYIGQLTEDERTECWIKFYMRYMQICIQYGYDEGMEWLENKRTQDKIQGVGSQIDYAKLYRKCCVEADTLSLWVKIKKYPHILGDYLKNKGIYKVAIYGYYSRMADVLQKELLNDGICIEYIIDRKGRLCGSTFPVYSINDLLPSIDAIIVAPVGLYEETKFTIMKKENLQFLDLKQIIKKLEIEKHTYL